MAHPKRTVTRPEVLKRVRELCLSFPETSEKEAWGGPTFRVKDKMFVMYMDNHHGDGRVALWCNADADERDALVAGDSNRFFVPPYMGPRGWLGMRLDKRLGWKQIGVLVEESWRRTASPKVLAILDGD
jgi:predicted DNA-binding protein (MmcQ/YjbR family)